MSMGYVEPASEEIERLEQAIWEKERQLRALRSDLAALKAQVKAPPVAEEQGEEEEQLEEAVRRYEKAAGILSALEIGRKGW